MSSISMSKRIGGERATAAGDSSRLFPTWESSHCTNALQLRKGTAAAAAAGGRPSAAASERFDPLISFRPGEQCRIGGAEGSWGQLLSDAVQCWEILCPLSKKNCLDIHQTCFGATPVPIGSFAARLMLFAGLRELRDPTRSSQCPPPPSTTCSPGDSLASEQQGRFTESSFAVAGDFPGAGTVKRSLLHRTNK